MRGKLPAYLSKDQRGNYHFRARVPKALQPHLRKSEIRRSLGTDSYREAVRLARAYRVEFDKFCEEAMRKKKKIKPLALDYTVIGPITFADGRRIDKIEIDHPDPEAERKLVASALASIAQSEAPAPLSETPKLPLLSEIIDRYIREKTSLNHWKS